ncbi:2OG-Fe dioxygenase family protein [Candidatus Kaiserbacteria bacterium]|nr:2OG-Fe dioxygenase family protein [Candidatus Kaiserbacteria bacterium]
MFPYLMDEKAIATEVGHPVPPMRVFTLGGLGIDTEAFINTLRPTFSVLAIDPYDMRRAQVEYLKNRLPQHAADLNAFLVEYFAGRAGLTDILHILKELNVTELCEFDRIGFMSRRKRSIARFRVLRDEHTLMGWMIDRVPAKSFAQNVGTHDVRSLVRVFPETPESVTENNDIQKLIRCFANMVHELHPNAEHLRMHMHHMFVFADISGAGTNAPEGIHQDGSDYIVSALVIERAGIVGGESVVYALDKKTEYLRRTLAPGEGIFQADKDRLWHYVTPIKEDPDTFPRYGHRSILGFDIDIIR